MLSSLPRRVFFSTTLIINLFDHDSRNAPPDVSNFVVKHVLFVIRLNMFRLSKPTSDTSMRNIPDYRFLCCTKGVWERPDIKLGLDPGLRGGPGFYSKQDGVDALVEIMQVRVVSYSKALRLQILTSCLF